MGAAKKATKVKEMDKRYLVTAKELQKKHESLMLKQAHFIERITGNN